MRHVSHPPTSPALGVQQQKTDRQTDSSCQSRASEGTGSRSFSWMALSNGVTRPHRGTGCPTLCGSPRQVHQLPGTCHDAVFLLPGISCSASHCGPPSHPSPMQSELKPSCLGVPSQLPPKSVTEVRPNYTRRLYPPPPSFFEVTLVPSQSLPFPPTALPSFCNRWFLFPSCPSNRQ